MKVQKRTTSQRDLRMRTKRHLTTLMALLLAPLAYGQIQADTDRYLCNLEWDVGVTGEFAPPAAFSDDETMVAIAMWTRGSFSYHDGRLVVLEVPSCNILRDIYMARTVSVSSIAFSPDNRYIAVDRRNRISVYDLHSSSDHPHIDLRYRVLSGINGYVGQYVQFSADGTKLFMKGYKDLQEKVFTFPVADWKDYTEFDAQSLGVYDGVIYWSNPQIHPPIVHSPDRRYVVITYGGGSFSEAPTDYHELHVYDLEAGERVCVTDQVYELYSVDWSPDGSKILTTGEDEWTAYAYSNITTIDPQTCDVMDIWEWQPEGERPGRAMYLDDDHILLTAGGFGIWNLSSREKVETFTLREKEHAGTRFPHIGIRNRVSSRNGGYFAGTRTSTAYIPIGSTNTPSVFLLFRWNASSTRVSFEEQPTLTELQVYPNPVVDQIRFSLVGHVRMFDLLGREVLSATAVGQGGVSVDHLSPGVYLYRFASKTGAVHSGRLIKH